MTVPQPEDSRKKIHASGQSVKTMNGWNALPRIMTARRNCKVVADVGRRPDNQTVPNYKQWEIENSTKLLVLRESVKPMDGSTRIAM